VAILHEERFLVKKKSVEAGPMVVGFGQSSQYQTQQTSFGTSSTESVKSKIIHLISAIRTLLRSK
jgi:hypothetical protein